MWQTIRNTAMEDYKFIFIKMCNNTRWLYVANHRRKPGGQNVYIIETLNVMSSIQMFHKLNNIMPPIIIRDIKYVPNAIRYVCPNIPP